jgi:hypothetical protein
VRSRGGQHRKAGGNHRTRNRAPAHESFAGVVEAEINPLLVKRAGEGVVAVDGLVVLKR